MKDTPKIEVPDLRPKLPFGWVEIESDGEGPSLAFPADRVSLVARNPGDEEPTTIYLVDGTTSFKVDLPQAEVLKRIASALDD